MITVFTLGTPNEQIRKFAKEIAALPTGVYNLPADNQPEQSLLDKLYTLGVGQIIHDGTADEIHCQNGYFTPAHAGLTKDSPPDENILTIIL
ncbi:MAG: hypothetical protein ABIE84_06320 [bacterium]